MMTPALIIGFILCYFGLLLLIAWFTSRKSTSESYFTGNKASPWYAVAFGMLGDSLSGVTYISVPGKVGTANFSYFQLVLGYFVGYIIISKVLLPLYYKKNLLSIYSYLNERFGRITQKTGSFFFILSRTLGAGGRLYLAAAVIQLFVFDQLKAFSVPFPVSVTIIIALMLLYTYKGGIKTLVWTDTLQSLFLIAGVILSIIAIANKLDVSLMGTIGLINDSGHTTVFNWDYQSAGFFPKQFLGGIFIAVAMTGLDQNMMQKNLSCKSLPEAQKNIFWFSVVMVIVNLFFLSLGAILIVAYQKLGIPMPATSDQIFPNLALNSLGVFAGLSFILGLTAATFSSADSVLTTLTTSTYIDMFEMDKNENLNEKQKSKYRHIIHVSFAILLLICIIVFRKVNDKAIIDTIIDLAGYTYGPLLGLFGFGVLSKRRVPDLIVPIICVAAPIITYVIMYLVNSDKKDYQIGPELILINGGITYLGLLITSRKGESIH